MAIAIKSAIVAALVVTASARKCQNITVPISISARNGVFSQQTPVTNIDVTDFVLNNTQQGHNYSQAVLTGYATVSGNYKLAATYCEPDSPGWYGHGHGGSGNVVQLLTHGIGFDRSYWDLSFNNYNYSYVEQAVDHHGYSTLTWDRLGIGMSSHGEPVNEIQAYLEVAALRALTTKLKKGTIPGIKRKFKKVVLGGHSFGSEHTYLLTAMSPTIADGIFLTGFSQNGSFVPFFELGANLIQANTVAALSAYPNGYLANGLPTGVQIDFFSPGDFDPAILTLAYNTGKPVTVGELLTIGGETAVPNTFPGPVLIITGQRDVPYCGGDCLATGNPALSSIPASSQQYFPNTKINVSIVPGAGHGLNLEYSHTITYSNIFSFLAANGLSP